jgi:hypothetical protein
MRSPGSWSELNRLCQTDLGKFDLKKRLCSGG